ncbi:TraB/GumN family protein [Pseudemcibacter aquimaris]|uniref:TraB/GumN family protein n=1 Tax=Pseudemcibacter aquimaris TaxID=2857064 RepID=UPI002010F518|nr:TraB/GumN family protein [Pseudemcibacter aquimaris]MCC3861482.1 TraB/GumN family protein [Pseudemcibacter aquimaris]WDU58251.1 TraB/GumN family protein [Pseudemcibacter aquimaris]
MTMGLLQKFKRVFIAVIFFHVMVISAIAQETINATPAMWLIEKGEAKTYMLGSIHLLPPEVKWYEGRIENIVNDADEVVFEVHMTPEKQRLAQQITLQNGMLTPGDNLGNYMSAEELEFVKTKATEFGIPAASVVNFKPWFASVALSVSAIIREGWNPESGVDKYIDGIATSKNIPISELETLEAQMKTLYDHPLEVQAAMLIDTLQQLQDIKEVTMGMINSWADGDEDKMVETLIVPMKKQEEVYQKLLIERNQSWIPVIENLINKQQTTLIVAGAAHFVGDDGVIKMLRDKGYDVKKVQ